MNEWLKTESITPTQQESRFPTGSEVAHVLRSLADHEVKINNNGIGAHWQGFISSKNLPEKYWALLNIREYTGDDLPQEIYFEKGDEELIKLILKKLTYHCGPLVLIADCGGAPQLINPQ
jgi:hypothetical protein